MSTEHRARCTPWGVAWPDDVCLVAVPSEPWRPGDGNDYHVRNAEEADEWVKEAKEDAGEEGEATVLVDSRRYVPASFLTQLVEGLEAEVERLREAVAEAEQNASEPDMPVEMVTAHEAEAHARRFDANRLQALIDKHKAVKEGS